MLYKHRGDPLEELLLRARKTRPEFGKGVVFDVGANSGQTYRRFRNLLPKATLHCFEPAPETFQKLKQAVGKDKLAFARQIGLASLSGRVKFSTGLGTGNHRMKELAPAGPNQVEIEVLTGDDYCKQSSVSKIDFLKVDAEGYDLDVLVGFGVMLREGRISYLQVECTTSLDNRFHVHLERFIHFLHPFNYRLSDIVEPERKINATGQNLNGLWYCNAVFAREVDAPRLRRDGIN